MIVQNCIHNIQYSNIQQLTKSGSLANGEANLRVMASKDVLQLRNRKQVTNWENWGGRMRTSCPEIYVKKNRNCQCGHLKPFFKIGKISFQSLVPSVSVAVRSSAIRLRHWPLFLPYAFQFLRFSPQRTHSLRLLWRKGSAGPSSQCFRFFSAGSRLFVIRRTGTGGSVRNGFDFENKTSGGTNRRKCACRPPKAVNSVRLLALLTGDYVYPSAGPFTQIMDE